MGARGLHDQVTSLLEGMNAEGGYVQSLVCTDQGLEVASAGERVDHAQLAGLTSLFADIVVRAERDLSMRRVDEVTLLDPGRGRTVIRPLPIAGEPRMFLVVQVPTRAYWRRATSRACDQLVSLLAPLTEEEP